MTGFGPATLRSTPFVNTKCPAHLFPAGHYLITRPLFDIMFITESEEYWDRLNYANHNETLFKHRQLIQLCEMEWKFPIIKHSGEHFYPFEKWNVTQNQIA